jgi:CubicO group peptidase (beta-lactamase class C family)
MMQRPSRPGIRDTANAPPRSARAAAPISRIAAPLERVRAALGVPLLALLVAGASAALLGLGLGWHGAASPAPGLAAGAAHAAAGAAGAHPGGEPGGAVPAGLLRTALVPGGLAAAHRAVAADVGTSYPGAVVAFGVGERVERVVGLGRIGWRAASPPVQARATLYDLASLTKALATTVAVLLLVEDGVIALDEPVRTHLPAFEGKWKEAVTWRHLLTHTSGLAAGAKPRGRTPEERLRRVLRMELQAPPGIYVNYSDVGFIVLWEAATRAAGEPLPALLQRRVYEPLGMNGAVFSPGEECDACAPTLRLRDGTPFRGRPADLLAREVGGVTGNAGLFATGPDVARFAAMIAAGGALDGVRVLREESVAELFRQQPGAGRRTLGWTAFCPEERGSAARPCDRPLAYGHTGWTGTSLWIEPATGHWVVLLSNRSYERTPRPPSLEALRRTVFAHVAGLPQVEPPPPVLVAPAPSAPPSRAAPPRRPAARAR